MMMMEKKQVESFWLSWCAVFCLMTEKAPRFLKIKILSGINVREKVWARNYDCDHRASQVVGWEWFIGRQTRLLYLKDSSLKPV